MAVLEARIDGYRKHGGIYDHETIRKCLKVLACKPAVHCLYEKMDTRAMQFPRKLVAYLDMYAAFPEKMPLLDVLFLVRHLGRVEEDRAGYSSPVKRDDARSIATLSFFVRFWNNRYSGVCDTFYRISYSEFINVLFEHYGEGSSVARSLKHTAVVKKYYNNKANIREVFKSLAGQLSGCWRPFDPLQKYVDHTRRAVLDVEKGILKPMLYAFQMLEDEKSVFEKYDPRNVLIPDEAPEDIFLYGDE